MLKIQNVSDIWILVIEIYLGFVILDFGFVISNMFFNKFS